MTEIQQTQAPDPYRLLGVSTEAGDEEIREAYHRLLLKEPNNGEIQAAYGKIRNAQARERHLYLDPLSCIDPSPLANVPKIELDPDMLEGLFYELALLSDWELAAIGETHD